MTKPFDELTPNRIKLVGVDLSVDAHPRRQLLCLTLLKQTKLYNQHGFLPNHTAKTCHSTQY